MTFHPGVVRFDSVRC